MDLSAAQRNLEGPIGGAIRHRPRMASTMDAALAAAAEGAAEGTVISTDDQFAGRGRHGRAWLNSPGDDLALSVVLRPPADALGRLFIACALAVGDCAASAGIAPRFKWPNDVMAQGRKLAGVLIETVQEGDRLAAVAGMGVNVNMAPDHAAVREHNATSMRALCGRKLDRAVVLNALLRGLNARYAQLQEGRPLVEEWRASLMDVERPVRTVTADGREFKGVARGVDGSGRLVVADGRGETVLVAADDVVLLDG